MSAHPNDPRVLAHLRRMSGEERVRRAAAWYEALHAVMAAGVRGQHPEWDDARVRAEVRRRCQCTRESEGMVWP